MQDHPMQIQPQPFVKLAQANMSLLMQFSTSPEVAAQASANASHWLMQASESTLKLMQSGAYAHMVQGLLKNYVDFLSELGQGGMALALQGQAAMSRQAQEATASVIEATETRGRRSRAAR